MRSRFTVVDLMLAGATVLWGLNAAFSKYVLSHGFDPVPYATVRFFCATLLFIGFTLWREGTLRIERRDWALVGLCGVVLAANQLAFVYAIHLTNASTVSLVFGAAPIFIGVGAALMGLERMRSRFWFAALVSLGGVGLIALGGGGVSTRLNGDLLAVGTALAWAAYSVLATPLMQRYSPYRISALVLGIGWLPLAAIGMNQTIHQGYSFGALTWLGFVYAIFGPLFLTNILWFTAIHRVGPSRAGLFGNFQPFVGAFFALLILGEHLGRWEIAGGVLIAGGIVIERTHRIPLEPPGD